MTQFGNNQSENFLASLTEIGTSAFTNCGIEDFAKNSVLGNLTKIGESAFKRSAIKHFSNENDLSALPKLETIGKSAFEECTNLTEFIISSSKFNTFNDLVFSNCTNLKYVKCKESITTIYTGSFFKCESLTQIGQTPNVISLPYLTKIIYGSKNGIFNGCSSFTTKVGTTVTGGVILDLGSKLTSGTITTGTYTNVFGPMNTTPPPNNISAGVTIKLGKLWEDKSNIGILDNQKYWILKGGPEPMTTKNSYKVFNIIDANGNELLGEEL